MGEISKHFIEQFHNLAGDTVNEKYRNLFLLFNKNHKALFENNEELEFITTNLRPKSYLEKIFRIDFLIHFRRSKEILQEFLSGDEVVMKKARKLDWVFQDLFKNVGAEEFVNEVLPTIPYVVKFKILKKLSADEQRSDEIFDALHKRYGIFFATTFLHRCSASKISETLEKNIIKLTPSQLKVICKKDVSAIHLYFEKMIKHEGNADCMKDNPVLIYLASNYPEMFIKLFNLSKDIDVHLGYKTTIKFLDSQNTEVLEKFESYYPILNDRALVEKLGDELKKILCKRILPKSPCRFYWENLLKYYPKNQRFDLFKTAYNATFYHKFGENVDAISDDIMKIIIDPIEREKIAILQFQKDNYAGSLQYVTPTYFLNYLKNVCNKADYVEAFTKCCILNKDLDSLLEIYELLSERFKNDTDTCEHFFYPLESNLDILDSFTEKHWKIVMKIMAYYYAKEDAYYGSAIRLKYLEYLFKNGKPIREIILKYPRKIDQLRNSPVWNNPEICKQILCEFIELGPSKNEDTIEFDNYAVALCVDFNKEYPDHKISVSKQPRIRQTLKKVLETENTASEDSFIEHLICQNGSSEWLEEIKMLYFQNIKTFGRTSIILWFLKYEPKTFQKFINNYLEDFTTIEEYNLDRKLIWKYIKKYTHLGLDEDVVNFCKAKLNKEGTLSQNYIEALAILSPGDSYLEFVKSYISSVKIDNADDDSENFQKLQCDLVKFMRLIKSPVSVLPIALEFCYGNYLNSALSPLYSCLYRLPENEAKLVIQNLSHNDYVKKHAMHLSCAILDRETACNDLKNPSMPSLLPATKYFIKNMSDCVWTIVEMKLHEADGDDLHAFKWVLRKQIPLNYKMKYIEVFWKNLNEGKKKQFIKEMDVAIIQQLPSDFTLEITEKNMLKMVDRVIADLLIHLDNSRKFEVAAKVFNSFKENDWTCRTSRREARTKLNYFIETVFTKYIESESANNDFAEKFSSVFTSIFSPSDAFEEFIIVSLLKLKGKSMESCAEIIVEFYNTLISKYDKLVTDTFSTVIKECILPYIFKTDDEIIKFCYCILNNKTSIADYLLLIALLPEYEPQNDEPCKLYHEILADLEQVTDDLISLRFNLYLKFKVGCRCRRYRRCPK